MRGSRYYSDFCASTTLFGSKYLPLGKPKKWRGLFSIGFDDGGLFKPNAAARGGWSRQAIDRGRRGSLPFRRGGRRVSARWSAFVGDRNDFGRRRPVVHAAGDTTGGRLARSPRNRAPRRRIL